MKKTIVKKPIVADHFTRAANILVERMETPDAFMEFLANAISWIHNYELDNEEHEHKKDAHFNIVVFMEHVIPPWYKGGPNMIKDIATGMEKVHDTFGYEGYYEGMAGILKAYAKDMDNYSGEPKFVSKELNGINTLFEIGFCFYELDNPQEKNNAA